MDKAQPSPPAATASGLRQMIVEIENDQREAIRDEAHTPPPQQPLSLPLDSPDYGRRFSDPKRAVEEINPLGTRQPLFTSTKDSINTEGATRRDFIAKLFQIILLIAVSIFCYKCYQDGQAIFGKESHGIVDSEGVEEHLDSRIDVQNNSVIASGTSRTGQENVSIPPVESVLDLVEMMREHRANPLRATHLYEGRSGLVTGTVTTLGDGLVFGGKCIGIKTINADMHVTCDLLDTELQSDAWRRVESGDQITLHGTISELRTTMFDGAAKVVNMDHIIMVKCSIREMPPFKDHYPKITATELVAEIVTGHNLSYNNKWYDVSGEVLSITRPLRSIQIELQTGRAESPIWCWISDSAESTALGLDIGQITTVRGKVSTSSAGEWVHLSHCSIP